MSSIKIQDNEFPTKVALEKFVRNIIYVEVGECSDVKNQYPEHYVTLIEVLKRHPNFDTKAKDLANIKIQKTRLNKALEIIIVNTDLTEIDISWKLAISGKCNSPTKNLISAMRNSVKDQISRFKSTSHQICEKCKSTHALQVDHIIHFEHLYREFRNDVQKEGIRIPKNFEDEKDGSNMKCFKETDGTFKNKWIKYHQENAKLRILCKKCNLTREKYKK